MKLLVPRFIFPAFIVVGLLSFAAWITHVAWAVKALSSSAGASASQMVLGALGAFVPPIGVIHGVILWLS